VFPGQLAEWTKASSLTAPSGQFRAAVAPSQTAAR
jgi:hypothetical protein